MSVVAAAMVGEGVAIGTDSRITTPWASRPMGDKMLVLSPEAAVGFVGTGPWGVFKLWLEDPQRRTGFGGLGDRELVLKLVERWRGFVRERGHGSVEDGTLVVPCSLLVAHVEGLWLVTGNGDAVRSQDPFLAIGSGAPYALGAMFNQHGSATTAADLVRRGLLAACQFDNYCGAPVHIKDLRS